MIENITTTKLNEDEVKKYLTYLKRWIGNDPVRKSEVFEALGEELGSGPLAPLKQAIYFITILEGQKRCLLIKVYGKNEILFCAIYDKPKDGYRRMAYLLNYAIYGANSALQQHCKNSKINFLKAIVVNSFGGKETLDKLVELNPVKCKRSERGNPINYKISLGINPPECKHRAISLHDR